MRNSILLPLILATSLTYGCDQISPGEGDKVDTDELADVTLDDLPAELQDLIGSDLLAEMASQDPDAVIDVIIELDSAVPEHGGEAPLLTEMINHPVHGTQYMFNDVLGDEADLAEHMDSHYEAVQRYADALHDLRREVIGDFLDHNGWEASHPAHGPAMDSLHHDVRHSMVNRDIPAFVLHNAGHLFGLHLVGEPEVAAFDAAVWTDSLDEVMTATSLDGASAAYGGKGISIYIHEHHCPTDAIMGGGDGSYTGGDEPRGSDDEAEHADTVGYLIANAAPDADFYCSVESGGGYFPSSTWLLDLHINTISAGGPVWVGVTKYGGEYSRDAMTYDNNTYDYGVAHFTASGNGGGGTLAAISTGANSISIGSWDGSNGTVADYSSHDDSQNLFSKPEVVMHHVVSADGTVAGTSFATPLAAGLAANVLEDHAIFRKHPALLKAHLMSSAHKVSDTGGGAGYLDWQTASWGFNYLMWATGPDFEDTDLGEVFVKSSTLEANTTYRAALAWLADGDWIREHNELNIDLDLMVCSPSGACWAGANRWNAWELVEFETTEAGEYTYTIIINRREVTALRNTVKLGLAVNAVAD